MRIDEIINEGVNDKHIFKAIMFAGGPGSGKNYVEDKVIKGYGLKTLDIDFIHEYHYTKYSEGDSERIHDTSEMREYLYLEGRLGVVIQGTGNRSRGYKENLESLGYETMMIFVNTELETALDRNQQRARLIDPDEDDLTEIWDNSQKDIPELKRLFGNNFHMVDNNDGSDLGEIDKIVRQFVNRPVNNPRALQWIEDQKKQNKKK